MQGNWLHRPSADLPSETHACFGCSLSHAPTNSCGCRMADFGWKASGICDWPAAHRPDGSSALESAHPCSEPESKNRWGRRASSHHNRCESPEYRAGHGRGCAGGRLKADVRALSPAYCGTRFFGCVLRSSPVLRDSRRVLGEASDAPAYPNTRHGAAPMSRAAVPVFGEMAVGAKGRPCSHAPAPDKPLCYRSL